MPSIIEKTKETVQEAKDLVNDKFNGQETTGQKVGKQVDQGLDKANELKEGASDKAVEMKEKASDKAQDLKEKTQETAEGVKTAAKEKAHNAAEKVEEATQDDKKEDDGVSLVEKMKNKFNNMTEY